MTGFNSHKNGEIYISEEPVTENLNETQYEALSWIKIGGAAVMPDAGVTQSNTIFQPLEGAACKAKGNFDAGDPDITYKLDSRDVGQIKLREAGRTSVNDCFGFRQVLGDKVEGFTATNIYSRGVFGPQRIVGGDGDAAIVGSTTIGLSQEQLRVDPQVI